MNDANNPASFIQRTHAPKTLTEEERQANMQEWLVHRIIFVMTQPTKLTNEQCIEAVHEASRQLGMES